LTTHYMILGTQGIKGLMDFGLDNSIN